MKFIASFLCWILVSGIVFDLPSFGDEKAELALKARQILEKHCHSCHGKSGTNEGGLNFILSLDKLVAKRLVVGNKASESPLLERIKNGEMPPEEITSRPAKDEIVVLENWIAAGAPIGPRPARAAISFDAIAASVEKDLLSRDERDRPYMRYFTLTNLYNAGDSEDELETTRLALAKLINSLSWNRRLAKLNPIDKDQTILQLDIRDVNWSVNIWEGIIGFYPYGVVSKTESGKQCRVLANTSLPILRADWFVANASRPPLYHGILQIPKTQQELEKLLRIDSAQNIRQSRVSRAGFARSGVSRHNRIIERHETPFGACWISYDFAGSTDRRNIFRHPLGPNKSDNNSFQQDGGEIIFHLPNGMLGFMLVDENGSRIDKGPTEIVSDPKQPDRAVVNGVSCISCHYGGIIPKKDEIQPHVFANRKSYPNANEIFSLYSSAKKFNQLQKDDSAIFTDGVSRLGIKVSESGEPITNVALKYNEAIDLQRAASEFGVTKVQLGNYLAKGRMSRTFGPLRIAGGEIKRDVMAKNFGDLVTDTRLGYFLKPKYGTVESADVSPAEPPTATPDGEGTRIKRVSPYKKFHEIKLNAVLSDLTISRDGRWLYVLNLTEGKIQKFSIDTLELEKESEQLADGTEQMRMPPNSVRLYTCAAPNGHDYHEANKGGRFQVINAKTMEIQNTITTAFSPWDFAVNDQGIIFATMGGGQSTSLPIIDSKKKQSGFSWHKHLWHRNIIRMTPDQKKIYLSIIDLSPKSMNSILLPRRITAISPPMSGKHSGNGGKFSMLPDGKGIVLESGQVFQISNNSAADFKAVNSVSPHISLATAKKAEHLFLGTTEKEIKIYSYPELNLEKTFKVEGIPYRMVYDDETGLLFCAVTPKEISGRLKTGVGNLQIFNVQRFIKEGFEDWYDEK